jgi:hypothetical protein
MTLSSTHFPTGQVLTDVLLTDFRRDNNVLALLMGTPTSRGIENWFRQMGPTGGYAAGLNIQRLVMGSLDPTDGYSTITSFPSSTEDPDLSSSYAAITTENQQIKLNRFAIGTCRLPATHELLNSSGNLLIQEKLRADAQRIKDKLEEGLLLDLISSGTPETAVSGVEARFGLDTSAEANLLADLAILAAAFDKQNVPLDDRYLILPSAARGKFLKWTNIVEWTRMAPGNVDLANYTIAKIMGFQLVFSNSLSSGSGVGICTQKCYFIMPTGFVMEELKDINRLGTYNRIWCLASWGAIGKTVSADDGNTWGPAKEGIFNITVS